MSQPPAGSDVALLVSGGIDSAILCVELVRPERRVFPLYVRCGFRWEEVELACLRRFLASVAGPGLAALHVLEEPVADLFSDHWSITGAVPGAETPDDAVYLPGRNVLLAAKAGVWCRLRGVEALALGSLRGNPFPDTTAEFFRDFAAVLNRALGGRLEIIRPFAHLSKADVLLRGVGLPLHETFSCLNPVAGLHCGACNKCAERRRGFGAVGMTDRTMYAVS